MRLSIQSNFVVPGQENEEGVEMDRSEITLKEFLEELSAGGAESY